MFWSLWIFAVKRIGLLKVILKTCWGLDFWLSVGVGLIGGGLRVVSTRSFLWFELSLGCAFRVWLGY